ncbi:hypothetical protein [Bacteroides uniformis]|uniref:Uncharacterized protein n=1 Tax=Bacteroides uniformis TaxID=820 RepID=A0A6I0LNQ8_BACUN|nr:hypothetical protein [Bacteroides uniformis]KAB4246634.1 hypothetical protein GAP49_18255 [Bacteroides uniformis]KAB4248373.1 hypothetical protein GAP48_18660 [Bacteroides uniformis]KAB4252372.1 hypothetical protein GAO04_09785 [Bacteroides uniformis]KAB4261322.1 hypothetical protein GAP40_09075 [Bacteroides uniformis]
MKNQIYSRSVTIRDNNMNRWCIEFEVREAGPYTRRNVDTLEEFEEHFEVSVCGEGGCVSGQCYDDIAPRTPGQKDLLDFWNKYHCCGMRGGTKAQDEYLHGEQYKKDFDGFVNLFSGYDKNFRKQFDNTSFNIMCKFYQIQPEHMAVLRSVIAKYIKNNPIEYILGLDTKRLKHDINDLYVKYIFLAIRGLYIDKGFKYGADWLYLPIPEDVCKRIDALCEMLQNEEKELSQSLAVSGDFNMAGDFEATKDIIEKVMEMRDCDEEEAKRFVALGIHLQLTFSDLDDTFQSNDDCLYEANGTEYYIGTEKELEQIASDRVYDDDEYEYFWREAVAAKSTTDSLKDWLKLVLQDGWCNILNSYDGKYESYNIDGEYICVSRR